jgi:hypothetical protein
MNDFSGEWQTTFGPMNLTQEGSQVRGAYFYMGIECRIEGKLERGKLVFRYTEPTVQGDGWFELKRHGKAFAGQYRPDGAPRWENWEGERVGFDGLWNSSFGLIRLFEEDDQVRGFYEVSGGATITGKRTDNELVFTYQEPKARGKGRFELAKDGLSFQGEWQAEGESGWRPWSAIRVRPRPNITWLVVVEAPWQRFLSDQEYSFGNMLREFFARVPQVHVRQRYFSNEAGLRKCLRDLMYIAEPVVLTLATHAQPDGITVDGQTIGVAALIDSLRHAGSLRHLHFSACLMMQNPAVVETLRAFSTQARVPISGYTTSVNWAQSAIIEFAFLEMLLSLDMSSAQAAEQLVKMLPFAGNEPQEDAAFRPAGFTIVLPGEITAASNGVAKKKRRTKVSR